MTDSVNPGPWTAIVPPSKVPPSKSPLGEVPPGKASIGEVPPGYPGLGPTAQSLPGYPGSRQTFPPNFSNRKPMSPFRANKNVKLILTEQDYEEHEDGEVDEEEEEEEEGEEEGDSPVSARSEPQSRISRWSSLRSLRSLSSAREQAGSSSRRARENYQLRLRIYFLEERLNQGQADDSTEEVIILREKLDASRSEHRLKDSLLQEAVEALAVLERDKASLQLLQAQGQGPPGQDDRDFIIEETFEDFPLENNLLGDQHSHSCAGQGSSRGWHEECLGPAYRSLIMELEQHRGHFQDLLTNIRMTNQGHSLWLQNEAPVVRKPEDCQPFFWEEEHEDIKEKEHEDIMEKVHEDIKEKEHEDIQEKEQLVQEWSRRLDHLDGENSEDNTFSECYGTAEEGRCFENFETEGAKVTLENLQRRFQLKMSGILQRIGDPDWPVVRRTGFPFMGFMLLLSLCPLYSFSSSLSSSLSSSPSCLPYVPVAFAYTDSV